MIDYRQVMKFEKKNVEKFLEDFAINYERDVDYTLVALDGDKINISEFAEYITVGLSCWQGPKVLCH